MTAPEHDHAGHQTAATSDYLPVDSALDFLVNAARVSPILRDKVRIVDEEIRRLRVEIDRLNAEVDRLSITWELP